MVRAIPISNQSKSEQNVNHFVSIFNGFEQNGGHFVLISTGFEQNGDHFIPNVYQENVHNIIFYTAIIIKVFILKTTVNKLLLLLLLLLEGGKEKAPSPPHSIAGGRLSVDIFFNGI